MSDDELGALLMQERRDRRHAAPTCRRCGGCRFYVVHADDGRPVRRLPCPACRGTGRGLCPACGVRPCRFVAARGPS